MTTTKRLLTWTLTVLSVLGLSACATKSVTPSSVEPSELPEPVVNMPRPPNEILNSLKQSEADSDRRRSQRLQLLMQPNEPSTSGDKPSMPGDKP